MRTRVIVATAVLLAAPLSAQEDVALRAGIGFSSLGGGLGVDSRTGPVIGVDVGFPLGAGLSLRPGVSYANRGFDRTRGAGQLLRTGSLSIGYVQTSLLLARPRLIGSGRLSLGVQAGPWFAIKVACDTSGIVDPDKCEGSDPPVAATDYGLMGGLGLSYGIMEGARISVDALYHVGLTDVLVYPPPTIGVEILTEQPTRSLALQVGVVLKT